MSNIWSWNCTREEERTSSFHQASIHGGNASGSRSTRDSDGFRLNFCLRAEAPLDADHSGNAAGRRSRTRRFSFFAYRCGLPPSASRTAHLAKHFVAVQRDVVGCLHGPLCHLLTVHVDLDFVWGDGDVDLRGGRRRLQLKHSILDSLMVRGGQATTHLSFRNGVENPYGRSEKQPQ